MFFSPLFSINSHFFRKKSCLNMTCCCHFWLLFLIKRPFFIKRLLFSIKNSPFFSSNFSPFSHHGECGLHLFFKRRYRPTSYQVARDLRMYTRQICFSAFFAKQAGDQGPRTVALRANPSSVYRERADSTSDRWSLSLRRGRESSRCLRV